MFADSLNIALSVHGALFFAVYGAHTRYGDRTEVFAKSLAGTNSVITTLHRDIAVGLALRLKPVFDGASAVIEIDLVDAAGNPIGEVSVNPTGSETYNAAVFDFVESSATQIVDYRLLLRTRDGWCRWAKFLSRVILLWLAVEGTVSGLLLWVKLAGNTFPERLVLISFSLPALLFVGCLTACFALLCLHDRITDLRRLYDLP